MKDELVGSWRLKSFEIIDPEGKARSWGSDIHGLLIYTADGYMSVSINKAVENKSTVEAQNLFDSILFYSGSYTIDGSTVRQAVTEASNPARIGKEMIRFATLDGDLLTLVTPEESYGKATLIWRKIR